MRIAGHAFLVTGGAGFIGSHLVDRLLSLGARRVTVFDNFVRGRRHNIARALTDARCQLFPFGGDITNVDEVLTATQDMDGVFHLAGLSLLHADT
ncbi:MAG: NAD-dependent epimerase/dehydratase family protein, partial [Deltaproteobacteria bacterium]|nr:NAD-dependent epimerase/dehydratase family protein [Deltaproteobacteria bacterium]